MAYFANFERLVYDVVGDGNGVAFIDDFEGSKRVTNPSILRRFWNISSAPIDLQNNQEYDQRNRLKMYLSLIHI